MTPSQAFFESFVNVEHKLLGRALRPLCIRHLLFLQQIGSPLVFTDKRITLADVEIAAIVCSSKSDEHSLTQLDTKKLSFFQRFKLGRWHAKNKGRDMKTEIAAFIAYQEDYLQLPERYETPDEEFDSAIPSLLMHAAAMIQATGWSEETVFNMPIGKVLWFNLAFTYMKTGKSDIISDKEMAAAAALRELTAAGGR